MNLFSYIRWWFRENFMPALDAMVIAERVASVLAGSSLTLPQAFEQLGLLRYEDNARVLAELDQLVFECEICGWWCELYEMDEKTNGICADCGGND